MVSWIIVDSKSSKCIVHRCNEKSYFLFCCVKLWQDVLQVLLVERMWDLTHCTNIPAVYDEINKRHSMRTQNCESIHGVQLTQQARHYCRVMIITTLSSSFFKWNTEHFWQCLLLIVLLWCTWFLHDWLFNSSVRIPCPDHHTCLFLGQGLVFLMHCSWWEFGGSRSNPKTMRTFCLVGEQCRFHERTTRNVRLEFRLMHLFLILCIMHRWIQFN